MENNISLAHEPHRSLGDTSVKNESCSSGVSWSAVMGGAFVAAALSLILLALGAGLGLSSVSPWSNVGASASTIGKGAIIWLIAMQIIASAMGGYMAGRLRVKWAGIHTDEVYFRDTAHGLLVWSVGLVITVYFLASAATSMVGGVASAATVAMNTAAQEGGSAGNIGYFVDTLLRSEQPSSNRIAASERTEFDRIFTHTLRAEGVSVADEKYLSQLVATRTGINTLDAEKRVSDVIDAARQAADTARKATAHSLLWIFVALLCGAFSASYAAIIGGRQRDHVKLI